MSAPTAPVAASFRDPAGRVFRTADAILRVIGPLGLEDFTAFQSSKTAQAFVASGRLVTATPMATSEIAEWRHTPGLGDALAGEVGAVVRHERVAFPSYPYEWPAEMLHATGLLTLDLALALFDEGLGLKDATPWNVLFRGPTPVFVDWLSVERRDPHDPTWLPYAQFVRTFLLPLLAHREFGMPLDQVFLSRREGLEPDEVYRASGRLARLKPSMLAHATLPTWLSRSSKPDQAQAWASTRVKDPARARYVLRSVFTRLRRAMVRLTPGAAASQWTGYMEEKSHYSDGDFARKERFVQAALGQVRPARVLDVGCNTGHFSALAAQAGARVIALDGDAAVAGRVWRRAQAGQLDILPLVVNLARPSPATGWRNAEAPSFLARAEGHVDLVLMLAVLHHLLVTERVPLGEILDLAADLTRECAVIEFVAPEDPMFRRLTRGRDHLHAGLSADAFETACRSRFDIVLTERAEGGTRALYLLRRRG